MSSETVLMNWVLPHTGRISIPVKTFIPES